MRTFERAHEHRREARRIAAGDGDVAQPIAEAREQRRGADVAECAQSGRRPEHRVRRREPATHPSMTRISRRLAKPPRERPRQHLLHEMPRQQRPAKPIPSHPVIHSAATASSQREHHHQRRLDRAPSRRASASSGRGVHVWQPSPIAPVVVVLLDGDVFEQQRLEHSAVGRASAQHCRHFRGDGVIAPREPLDACAIRRVEALARGCQLAVEQRPGCARRIGRAST